VIDAILGAAAAGNVGSLFPPSEPTWKDADSIELLRKAAEVLHARGYEVVNVDVAVVCETPMIGPHASMMEHRLAEALGVDADEVSVKGKTNEGMGWIGAGEGLAVHAVALIGSTRP
jgi:2-C-methyl-D-erythritol 2,4-cyclodiphosphate synthase